MHINDKIKLMELNDIPVSRELYAQGVAEAATELLKIIRKIPKEEKDDIDASCEKSKRAFHERHKELLDNLSPIPAVRLQMLVNELLKDSSRFADMSDQEAYEVIKGDFYDMFFVLDNALGDFSKINPKQAEGNITYLPETDGASIRESAEKIHEALSAMSNLLPCETEEDVVNVFRQYTVLFSHMQNILFIITDDAIQYYQGNK